MKIFSTTLAIFIVQTLFAGNANERSVKTETTDVTVFLNGAMVTRTGTTSLPQGTTTLLFEHVSPKIDKNSIRFTATNNVKVLEVEYMPITFTTVKQDSIRIKKLNDSLDYLGKEDRKINYQMKSYEEEKKMIELNDEIPKNGTNNIIASELQKMSDFYKTRMAEINKQLFLLSESKSELGDGVQRINKVINLLKSSGRTETYYVIKVIAKSPVATTSTVTLKYLSGASAWGPKYDIHVDGVGNEIIFDYLSNITNQSGEDWNNVNLTLSTADPTQSNDPPTLDPWTLNYKGQNYQEGKLDKYGSKEVSKSDAQRSSGGLALPDGTKFEEIEVPTISVEFPIKEKESIPSDGKVYLFDVANYKLQANFEYYAIPKLDKDAFLLGKITGWEKLNLLEGPTNIYFRETFVGNSYLKTEYANDTLDIALGRDSKIMINRIKVEDKNENKIIGLNKREKFSYKITVRNTNSKPVTIVMLDQVPVSQETEIEVEVEETSNAIWDKPSGELRWNITLAPNEAKEYTISFNVKYPKNKPVHVTYNSRISKRKVRSKFFAPMPLPGGQ